MADEEVVDFVSVNAWCFGDDLRFSPAAWSFMPDRSRQSDSQSLTGPAAHPHDGLAFEAYDRGLTLAA